MVYPAPRLLTSDWTSAVKTLILGVADLRQRLFYSSFIVSNRDLAFVSDKRQFINTPCGDDKFSWSSDWPTILIDDWPCFFAIDLILVRQFAQRQKERKHWAQLSTADKTKLYYYHCLLVLDWQSQIIFGSAKILQHELQKSCNLLPRLQYLHCPAK